MPKIQLTHQHCHCRLSRLEEDDEGLRWRVQLLVLAAVRAQRVHW
jgi:hypothetical protein